MDRFTPLPSVVSSSTEGSIHAAIEPQFAPCPSAASSSTVWLIVLLLLAEILLAENVLSWCCCPGNEFHWWQLDWLDFSTGFGCWWWRWVYQSKQSMCNHCRFIPWCRWNFLPMNFVLKLWKHGGPELTNFVLNFWWYHGDLVMLYNSHMSMISQVPIPWIFHMKSRCWAPELAHHPPTLSHNHK